MSRFREQYIKSFEAELSNNLFSIETKTEDSQWLYCYFLSKRRPIVYMLCLSTADFERERAYKKLAIEIVNKNNQDFLKQATHLMYEELQEIERLKDEKDLPIFQKCVKIHTGGNYHEIIKGVVDLPILNERVVNSFIQEFLDGGERYWYSSYPVQFNREVKSPF